MLARIKVNFGEKKKKEKKNIMTTLGMTEEFQRPVSTKCQDKQVNKILHGIINNAETEQARVQSNPNPEVDRKTRLDTPSPVVPNASRSDNSILLSTLYFKAVRMLKEKEKKSYFNKTLHL